MNKLRLYSNMWPTFGITKTTMFSTSSTRGSCIVAEKSFCPVEIYLLRGNLRLQPQKFLHFSELHDRFCPKFVPVDNMDLLQWKIVQPAANVPCIQTVSYGFVGSVKLLTLVTVFLFESGRFKKLMWFPFGQFGEMDLGIVRYGPIHRISHYKQKFCRRIHFVDPFRHPWSDKIAGSFLQCNLVVIWLWHARPVPFQAFEVSLVWVKKVDFKSSGSYLWIETEKLQQGTSAAFSRSNDDATWQSLAGEVGLMDLSWVECQQQVDQHGPRK